MSALLDVNVLVALAWPSHVHHEAAQKWFASHHSAGWATTPITEAGFVRVSSNPRANDDFCDPATAADLLKRACALEGHAFWPDSTQWSALAPDELEVVTRHQFVPDAHLALLARANDGAFVTFDRDAVALAERLGAQALLLSA